MNSRTGLLGRSLVFVAALTLALALPALASARDRNHDRIPDRWEKGHSLSLQHKQTKRDQDRDGLRNRAEFKAGMDPHDADSDNDGVEDGDEGAGVIASYDPETGRLTIDLFNSSDSVTGRVTSSTEVKCDGGDDQGDEDDDQGEDEQGDGNDGDDDQGEAHHRSLDGHPGDDGDDDFEEGDDQHQCSVAHLVPGAIVQEAELHLRDGDLVFEEIELRR